MLVEYDIVDLKVTVEMLLNSSCHLQTDSKLIRKDDIIVICQVVGM